jgi:hypothetical protein
MTFEVILIKIKYFRIHYISIQILFYQNRFINECVRENFHLLANFLWNPSFIIETGYMPIKHIVCQFNTYKIYIQTYNLKLSPYLAIKLCFHLWVINFWYYKTSGNKYRSTTKIGPVKRRYFDFKDRKFTEHYSETCKRSKKTCFPSIWTWMIVEKLVGNFWKRWKTVGKNVLWRWPYSDRLYFRPFPIYYIYICIMYIYHYFLLRC